MYLFLSYRKLTLEHFVVASKEIKTYRAYLYTKQSLNVTLYQTKSLYLNFTQIYLPSFLDKICDL